MDIFKNERVSISMLKVSILLKIRFNQLTSLKKMNAPIKAPIEVKSFKRNKT